MSSIPDSAHSQSILSYNRAKRKQHIVATCSTVLLNSYVCSLNIQLVRKGLLSSHSTDHLSFSSTVHRYIESPIICQIFELAHVCTKLGYLCGVCLRSNFPDKPDFWFDGCSNWPRFDSWFGGGFLFTVRSTIRKSVVSVPEILSCESGTECEYFQAPYIVSYSGLLVGYLTPRNQRKNSAGVWRCLDVLVQFTKTYLSSYGVGQGLYEPAN